MSGDWSAFFVGDIVIKNPAGEITSRELTDIISGHDIASCNFEAPVLGNGRSEINKIGPNLHQCNDAVNLVRSVGFNVISMANNHIYDYGQEALGQTISSFNREVVTGAGVDFESAYGMRMIRINGIKVGFLSFAEWGFGAVTEDDKRGGFAWVNHHSVNNLISSSKKCVDVLIVQVHAGVELINLPIPEWRQRYKDILDLGADVVIGHHPHVPQGWESYNGKMIFYSLGNFYFDEGSEESPYWDRGYAVSLTYNGSALTGFSIIPIEKLNGNTRICRDPQYEEYLGHLCEILGQDVYRKHLDNEIINLWNTRYKGYTYAVNGISSKHIWIQVYQLIKHFIKEKLNKQNYLLLLHNIRIESHRWSVERAVSLLMDEDSVK